MITETDRQHLRRCVALAKEALQAGDEPFGSVLVDADGNVLYEDRNRINTVEATYHPEIAVARWAAENLATEDRQSATVYTSGEHCAMCSAAHGWAGLGRIVYVSSSKQLSEWLDEWGVVNESPVQSLPIHAVCPDIPVEGPVAELSDQIKQLHKLSYQNKAKH